MPVSTKVNKQIARAVRRSLFPPVLRDPADPDPNAETPEEDIAFLRQAKVIPTAQERAVQEQREEEERAGPPDPTAPRVAFRDFRGTLVGTFFFVLAESRSPGILEAIRLTVTTFESVAGATGDVEIAYRVGQTEADANNQITQAQYDTLTPIGVPLPNGDEDGQEINLKDGIVAHYEVPVGLLVPTAPWVLAARLIAATTNLSVGYSWVTTLGIPSRVANPLRFIVPIGRRAGNLSTRGARPRGPRRRVPRFVTIAPISQRTSLGSRRIAWPFLDRGLQRRIIQAQIEGRALPGIFVEY